MKAHEKFIYDREWDALDFRAQPELYQIGVGEQGVLLVQPYKGEILPHWRFATPELAHISSEKIYAMFLKYKAKDDFVGMDMARKFLQMGFTRARRYANHKGGKKYDGLVPDDQKGRSGAHGRAELPRTPEDPIKAESARIFQEKYLRAKDDEDYLRMSAEHHAKYGKLQDEENAARAHSPKSTAPARRKSTS